MSDDLEPHITKWRGYKARDIIFKLGQSDGLKVVMDAGDIASVAASTDQRWLDTSGNGYDFFRGITVGITATDPTFNGTPGNLSSSEYWSFDGGDQFRYDTVNEGWMQNLHKDNAKFTIASWWWLPATLTSDAGIYGTVGDVNTGTGSFFNFNTTSFTLEFGCRNAGANVRGTSTTIAATPSSWNFAAESIDEAANTINFNINGASESNTCTYSSPSAANASQTMEIGTRGNSLVYQPATARIGMFMAWEARALSQGELRAIFNATRGRYGI